MLLASLQVNSHYPLIHQRKIWQELAPVSDVQRRLLPGIPPPKRHTRWVQQSYRVIDDLLPAYGNTHPHDNVLDKGF